MRVADVDILFVPGRSRAESTHWQRRWATKFSTAHWVDPESWGDEVRFEDRTGGLRAAVSHATRPVVLVAHSLGVLTVAHTAANLADTGVRGAFLVSPPDFDGGETGLPEGLRQFGRVPRDPLPFPSLLVASTDDPLCPVERAVDLATAWGSDLHLAQNAGHINVASGHGPWPEGLMMFTRLMQRLG